LYIDLPVVADGIPVGAGGQVLDAVGGSVAKMLGELPSVFRWTSLFTRVQTRGQAQLTLN
jgi:hypothetical protein